MKFIESSSAPLCVLRGLSFRYFFPFVTFVSFCSDFVLPPSSVWAAEIDFEKQVAPILTANCLKCHNSTKTRAGLNLSTREKALKGSDAGEVLVPGKPEESLLLQRAADGSMPPEADGRRLSKEEVDVLTAWVKAGAKWPVELVLSAAELHAESSQGAPVRSRRSRRLRIRRVYFHSRRDLAAAVEGSLRAACARAGGRGAGPAPVEQAGEGPAAAAAREAEGNQRQGGNG
jgi:cytochrome c